MYFKYYNCVCSHVQMVTGIKMHDKIQRSKTQCDRFNLYSCPTFLKFLIFITTFTFFRKTVRLEVNSILFSFSFDLFLIYFPPILHLPRFLLSPSISLPSPFRRALSLFSRKSLSTICLPVMNLAPFLNKSARPN